MSKSLFHVDTVTCYLLQLKPNMSPIKLHKSLYFLFAYYASIHEEILFKADFEAWKFGPVIQDVYTKYCDHYYLEQSRMNQSIQLVNNNPEIKHFIDDLFSQIDSVSDFTLVERSHQDEAWKKAYRLAQPTVIDNDELIQEYKTKYVTC
ncbi:type II toxin-antitoxin system antitoxin SocA domain-containing protein [Paenibacillus sp. FSL P4-0176]|uniref:Panacea domain-containing protein n=1 Tax=Paenibacillus sp. FSL P4-0176 TaxID=2921631 RepID=UPI0030D02023